jgi:hypothetical protein
VDDGNNAGVIRICMTSLLMMAKENLAAGLIFGEIEEKGNSKRTQN